MPALFLAIGLAPLEALAQASSKGASQAAEQREREAREWREIHRTQDRMRELDEDRAEERRRQDEEWRRFVRERDQQKRAVQSAPSGDSSRPGAYASPGPYAPPAATSTPRTYSAPETNCSAHPVCMAATGRANVCMGVQRSYAGAHPERAGIEDIVRRCREANTPDPCGTARPNPAAPSYKLPGTGTAATTAAGCMDQCARVARCTPAARR